MKPRIAFALAAALGAGTAFAQPVPIGITAPKLSDQPYVFDTAEQHGIKITVLAKGFTRPFAIEFTPAGDLLLQERGGALRVIRNATAADAALDPAPIPGMPTEPGGIFSLGVQDISLHPDFASNHLIYFTYNAAAPVPEGNNPLQRPGFFRLMRAKLEGGQVSEVETLFATELASYAGGSRVALDKDGMVWVATGAPFGQGGQDPASPYGKVLRFNADGSIPADNPIAGSPVYTLGHRDQHGLVIHPETGDVFSAEHGPNGGDEVNRIRPGGNYGWPLYTYGKDYDGKELTELPTAPGYEKPLLVFSPGIAPSGLMFYTGDRFPAWKGNIFVGSARWGQVNQTGSLVRTALGENYGELRRERLLLQLHQRVRDMVQGPDGNIYVLTDGPENAVLRVEPSE
ncbi:MAG TPA: PQQ-dependent sugar dehydrogenase [Sphingomonadaceae bacterium]|nr:PQQ-dependent sugar dehydrogenase [Sphingomonadaceae bacterium]